MSGYFVVDGDTYLGNSLSNTHIISGSVIINGSLSVISGSNLSSSLNVFGSEYRYDQKSNIFSTTSNEYQEFHKLDIDNVPTGFYRLMWNFKWKNEYRKVADFRITLNGTSDFFDIRKKSNDIEENSEYGILKTFLNSGTHYVNLNVKNKFKGIPTTITDSRLEFLRIA